MAVERHGDLCTIAYQPEAHDSAASHLRRLQGYTVTVVPVDGEPFDAALLDVMCDADDGQYKAVLAKWDEDAGHASDERVTLDIYDQIERLEII